MDRQGRFRQCNVICINTSITSNRKICLRSRRSAKLTCATCDLPALSIVFMLKCAPKSFVPRLEKANYEAIQESWLGQSLVARHFVLSLKRNQAYRLDRSTPVQHLHHSCRSARVSSGSILSSLVYASVLFRLFLGSLFG